MCFICYEAQAADSGLLSITLTSLVSQLMKHWRDASTLAWASAFQVKSLNYGRPESVTDLFPLDGAGLSKLTVMFNILSHNDEAGWGYLQPNSPKEGTRCLPPSVKSQSADTRNRRAPSAWRKLPSFPSISRHKAIPTCFIAVHFLLLRYGETSRPGDDCR